MSEPANPTEAWGWQVAVYSLSSMVHAARSQLHFGLMTCLAAGGATEILANGVGNRL